MSQIEDILIFYSNNSNRCSAVKNLVSSQKLPVSMICVDSKRVRDSIKNGKLKIQFVPSLAVIYDNMTAEVYEGDSKVISWLYKTFENKLKQIYQSTSDQFPQPIREDERTFSDTERTKTVNNEDENSSNKKLSKMEEIQALAREMEQQRKKTLGRDDDDNES